jgi:uncharacterized protein DUF3108
MFKKTLTALALVVMIVSAGFARRPATDKKTSSELPFAVGERLSYDVSWSNFVVAGELVLETKDRRSFDGVDAFHVTAQAQSVGIVSVLGYKVNDVYESFLNASTLEPLRAEKRTRHGKKRGQESIVIDHQKRTATLSDGRVLEIPPNTYDLAGLLYAVRASDLAAGKPRTFTLIEDGKLYTLNVEVEGREKVRTRAGEFDTLRVATRTIGGRESKDPYKLRIYITSDWRRMPVLITAEPSWGEVRVELTSAVGTKKK